MSKFLTAWSPRVLSVLRLVTGFLFLWHGSQKMFNFPPMPAMPPRIQEPSFGSWRLRGAWDFFADH